MEYELLNMFSMPYYQHASQLLSRVQPFRMSEQGIEALAQINVCLVLILPLLKNGATYTWQVHHEAINQIAKAERLTRALEQQNEVAA